MSHLRDPRAADLDRRLESREAPVANPFGDSASQADK